MTVSGDWEEELRPECWVVSQWSVGGQGKKGKKGREREGVGAPCGCRGTSNSSPSSRRRPTCRKPWMRAMGTARMMREVGVTTSGGGGG